MSVLENIYRQIRNEYVESLCRLHKKDFLNILEAIAHFPPTTLEKSHVHEIFRAIGRQPFRAGLSQTECDEINRQLWDSLLRTDGTGLLNPTADRRNLVSRWFAMDWGVPVLEAMTRHADSGLTATDWLRKIRRQKYMFSAESIEKRVIAYEQLYRLAGNRDEKYQVLLTAWKFRFSFGLSEDRNFYKRRSIDELLEEHICHFPEDIPRLRESFRELIIKSPHGRERRAGWAGIAVIGAGPHEPELLELLKRRLKWQDTLERESTHHLNAIMSKNPNEEIEGMTRWIPDAEHNRRILLQTWRSLLLTPAWHVTLWMDGNIPVALRLACLRLETSEEQVLKEITTVMDENFAEPHKARPGSGGAKLSGFEYKTIETMGVWQPESPEIRHRRRELWEKCLIRSWDNPCVPEHLQAPLWKNLVNTNPRHPRLAEFLMQYLSADRNREPHYHFRYNVILWLQEYGLPPETSPDIRQQLAQTAQEYFREILSGRPAQGPGHSETDFMLHILLATVTDPDGEKPPEQTEVVGEILLKDLRILLEVTDWAQNNPHPPARLWQPFVHRQWEKKLAILTPTTPYQETREVLRYFARNIRRDPSFVPPASLGGQLLSIIRDCEECELVVTAAHLGGQLVRGGRMDHDFSSLWNEAVRKRETKARREPGLLDRRLEACLHVIRKEALLYEISAWLNDNPFEKTTRDGTQKTTGKKTGHGRQTRADRETAERFLLRKLVHIFPEAGDGSCPERKYPEGEYPRLWSRPCVELILRRQTWQGTGKGTDGGEVGAMPVPESRLGRTPLFEDKSRLIPTLTTPEQMSGTKKWDRRPEDIRRGQNTTVPDRY